jgi:HSP90 family molecular chaperone
MTDSDRSEADPWPPLLTVDTARVLALLTGDRFYSSKDAALREAVLNAIDACARRSAAEPAAIPAITVEFDDTEVRVLASAIR